MNITQNILAQNTTVMTIGFLKKCPNVFSTTLWFHSNCMLLAMQPSMGWLRLWTRMYCSCQVYLPQAISSTESESEELSGAKGEVEWWGSREGDTGWSWEGPTGGCGIACGVNKRAAAHWFWAVWTCWATNGVIGFLALTGDFAGVRVSRGLICWAHLKGLWVQGRSGSIII